MVIRRYLESIRRQRKDDVSSYVDRIERLASKTDVKIHHMQISSYTKHLREAGAIRGKQGIEDLFHKIVSYILAHRKSPAANQVENWVEKLRKK